MAERFRTVATFDLAYKADLAKAALEEADIEVMVSNREVVSMEWLLSNAVGGVQLQVAEADVRRALAVLVPFTHPGQGERPVSDEELERQALAEPTEEGDLPPPEPPLEPTPPVLAADGPPFDREKVAWRAFWLAWFGMMCWPLWFLALYLLLRAACTPGPLSRLGRIRLWVAVGVLLLTVAVVPLSLSMTAAITAGLFPR